MGFIQCWVPTLPPTSNNIYTSGFHGKRVLTTPAKKWRNHATAHLGCEYFLATQGLDRSPETTCVLGLEFHVTDLTNKGWPNKAKDKFKKMDLSNRIKLLEDTWRDFVRLDDHHNFIVMAMKLPMEVAGVQINFGWGTGLDDHRLRGTTEWFVRQMTQEMT